MGGGGGGGQEIKFVDVEPQTVETTTDAYRQQLQLGEIAQAQNLNFDLISNSSVASLDFGLIAS